MARSKEHTATPPPSTPWAPSPIEGRDGRIAAGLAVGCFALYAATACRTFYLGDSSELAAAAAVFGIPHPPGYPTFTMVTGLLMRLVPLNRALAGNLIVGAYAAATVGLLWLLARRLGASRAGASVGSLAFAFGATFWAQGVATEVYGFDALLAMAAAHAALNAAKSTRATVLAALLFGVWLGHRPINILYAPTLVGFAWLVGAVTRRRIVPAMVGLALSTLPHLYLPLRARMHPGIDIGDPETFERFFVVVRGAPYVRHWTEGTVSLGVDRLERHLLALPKDLGASTLFALVGMFTLLRAKEPSNRAPRAIAALLVWTVIANSAMCVGYHVLDIEDFLLPSTWALAILASFGADVARSWVTDEGWRRWFDPLAIASSLALIAVNFDESNLRGHALARRNAEDTLEATPQNALLIVGGDTNIHALWYLQQVEGKRRDVIVVSPGHVLPWYVDQLKRQYPAEPWPSYGTTEIDQTNYVRAVRDALIPHHRVMLTRSIQLDPYIAPDANGNRFGTIPHGLVTELLPLGASVDLNELANFTEGYFDRVMAHTLPRPESVDLDSASLYLEYALSLSQNADLLVRSSRRELARKLFYWVLELHPDELERHVQEDVRAGLGLQIPLAHLESHAHLGLDFLDRPPAPATSASP